MDARKLTKLRKDLASFLDDVVGTLGNSRRRRWCETYVRGVLHDGQRKSIEPMSARLKKIEEGKEDYEQRCNGSSSTRALGMNRRCSITCRHW
ncbi:MAG: transposase [Planctomycetota bacterium]